MRCQKLQPCYTVVPIHDIYVPKQTSEQYKADGDPLRSSTTITLSVWRIEKDFGSEYEYSLISYIIFHTEETTVKENGYIIQMRCQKLQPYYIY